MPSVDLSNQVLDSAVEFAKKNPEWFRKNHLTLDGLIDTLYILEMQNGDRNDTMQLM